MKTRLLKKLRAEARKTWTIRTDNFGQAWIYDGQVAIRNVVCHKKAKKIVEELRRDFINFEVMYRRSRKRKQIKKIF